MLAYLLAVALALGSFSLYMSAFFFPEVYRKYDLLWSGVGLFYALVLWVCAGRITGGVLLGQVASVSLIGWLGWQTLTLRRSRTPVDQQTSISPTIRARWAAMQERLRGIQPGHQRGAKAASSKPSRFPAEEAPTPEQESLTRNRLSAQPRSRRNTPPAPPMADKTP